MGCMRACFHDVLGAEAAAKRRAEQLVRARRRSGSQPDVRFARPEKENGPGGKVRAVRVDGKDGWQLGEHVLRVMAATPLDALQPPGFVVVWKGRMAYP